VKIKSSRGGEEKYPCFALLNWKRKDWSDLEPRSLFPGRIIIFPKRYRKEEEGLEGDR